jgi:hypothetical protein
MHHDKPQDPGFDIKKLQEYVIKIVSKSDLQTTVHILPFLKKTDIHKAEHIMLKKPVFVSLS